MDTNQKNFKKLQDLLSTMDEQSLTKNDFIKSFENLVNLVLSIEKKNTEAITSLEQTYVAVLTAIHNEHGSSVADLKTLVANELKAVQQRTIQKFQNIDDKLNTLQDSKNVDKTKIVADVLAKIKLPEQKDVLADTPIQIRDKLETLQGDERIEQSAIKDLEEDIKALQEEMKHIPRGRVGIGKSPRYSPRYKRVRLTNQVDGNTRIFTLPKDTVSILALSGTEFPSTFDDNDWTFTGTSLTLANSIATPQAGQTLIALVETLFY